MTRLLKTAVEAMGYAWRKPLAHPSDRAVAASPSSPAVSPVPASIPCAFRALASELALEADKCREQTKLSTAFGSMMLAAEHGALLKVAKHLRTVAGTIEEATAIPSEPKP